MLRLPLKPMRHIASLKHPEARPPSGEDESQAWNPQRRMQDLAMESKPDRRYRHGFEPRWSARMGFDYSALRLVPSKTASRWPCAVQPENRSNDGCLHAPVVKSADTRHSKRRALRLVGSSPTWSTTVAELLAPCKASLPLVCRNGQVHQRSARISGRC